MVNEDLKEFIKAVNKIMSKHNVSSNDQVYSKIVEYVNNTFGIISNIDRDNIEKLEEIQQNQPISLSTFISGYNQPLQPIQSGDARLGSLTKLIQEEKQEPTILYTNIQFIIQRTISKMRKVLRKFNLADDTSSINKYIRNQYKLLKLKDATVEEYTNNLLYIINNIGENNMNDIQIPLMFHE